MMHGQKNIKFWYTSRQKIAKKTRMIKQEF